jgi:uncharacterized protein with HEPN domain
MIDDKLSVHVEQMLNAAAMATSYVEGYDRDDFLNDKRTQQAVTLNILIIGELATKIVQNHPDFADANADIPWSSMRNMRNRIAHGYYEVDFEVVWETVSLSVPPLVEALKQIKTGDSK